MSKPRLIAFYLPQFHPTKENDEWWGKGFTEWTNVGNAKPLFPGHYQPRVPADLGYYDLRIPEVREQQAELAREAGIEGFCYWHYWFNGKRLLDRPFKEVLESGKPDFPFCLCWANHSWYKKIWDPRKGKDKLLIEQTYPGEEDYIAHFNALLPAFKDKRYLKVNNKPIFGIFGSDIPDKKMFVNLWDRLARENGFDGFYFFARACTDIESKELNNAGFHVWMDYLQTFNIPNNVFTKYFWKAWRKVTPFPRVHSYDKYIKLFKKHFNPNNDSIPCLCPNFDHSPRSKHYGVIITGSTPSKWKELCLYTFQLLSRKRMEDNIILIKSWNEWGEGNYLEPDLKYGKGFIKTTKEALDLIPK